MLETSLGNVDGTAVVSKSAMGDVVRGEPAGKYLNALWEVGRICFCIASYKHELQFLHETYVNCQGVTKC